MIATLKKYAAYVWPWILLPLGGLVVAGYHVLSAPEAPTPPIISVDTEITLQRGKIFVLEMASKYTPFCLIDAKLASALDIVQVDKLHWHIVPHIDAPDGTYTMPVLAALGKNKLSPVYWIKLNLGAQPPPVPPTPPLPPTPPVPPSPPAPIPADGFRVMIVYDQKRLSTIPKEQVVLLTSGKVRDYLDTHCVKRADGQPEYRIWAKDVKGAENDSKLWFDTFSKSRGAPEWIIVSNGKNGVECPLPANEADLLTLLRKYGGA